MNTCPYVNMFGYMAYWSVVLTLHTSRVTYLDVDNLDYKVVTSTEKGVNGNKRACAWSVH